MWAERLPRIVHGVVSPISYFRLSTLRSFEDLARKGLSGYRQGFAPACVYFTSFTVTFFCLILRQLWISVCRCATMLMSVRVMPSMGISGSPLNSMARRALLQW